jgi:hemolysin D
MKSSRAVIALPGAGVRRREHELAFLPAALEIVETPPSPIGRAIGATIIALFFLALAWACWGSVDILATAPGKIIPSGRSKVVQPFETGVVHAIHVHDGTSVKAGDVLIELDPTINAAEREHLQGDLIAAQLDVARLRAALADTPDPLAAFHPPEGATAPQIATQRQFLLTQITEQRAKLAALDRQRAQKEAERDTSAATIGKIEALIPLLEQQVNVRKTLLEHETGSRIIYLQTLQQLVEQQQELQIQRSHYREADAAVAAIAETRAEAAAQYRRTSFDELAKAEPKVAALGQDLIKAEQRTRLQLLTAPIDGIVQQLAVHTIGAVVTPAQPLLVIVPTDSHLEIEATISNRDIGFLHPGQEADIKIDTFNFTRYGLLHGQVLGVSPDAFVPDPRVTDPRQGNSIDKAQGQAGGASTNDPTTKEAVYIARVSLDQTRMRVDDGIAELLPGMAVTVEIKTGSRRIISYLLSPLLRYGHDSLRER